MVLMSHLIFFFFGQQQVINAVSIAPVQMQATPIVSIASIAQPQTQIISSTPLAIAANTSQAQQLALASTQQAAHAGQLLGTSQITLATGRKCVCQCLHSNLVVLMENIFL